MMQNGREKRDIYHERERENEREREMEKEREIDRWGRGEINLKSSSTVNILGFPSRVFCRLLIWRQCAR